MNTDHTARRPVRRPPRQEAADSLTRSPTPRHIDSTELFLGQSLLLIRHLGEIYHLQTTRQGKLILTK